MSDVLSNLITGVATLAAGLGTTWITGRNTRKRDKDAKAERYRVEQRQAIIELLDSFTPWVRHARGVLFASLLEKPSVGNTDDLDQYAVTERRFGKALTTTRLLITDADVRDILVRLDQLRVGVLSGPTRLTEPDMQTADALIKQLELLAVERLTP